MILVFRLETIELLWGDLLVLNFGLLEPWSRSGGFEDDGVWRYWFR